MDFSFGISLRKPFVTLVFIIMAGFITQQALAFTPQETNFYTLFALASELDKSSKHQLCIDYNPVGIDGQPTYDIGFASKQFVTAESSGHEQVIPQDSLDQLTRILNALNRTYHDQTKVIVTGYADGQHFKGAFAASNLNRDQQIEKSIQTNQQLAADRAEKFAKQIESKMAADIPVMSRGEASPELERLFKDDTNGLECSTRRKVKISLVLPPSQLQSKASDITWQPFHDKMHWSFGSMSAVLYQQIDQAKKEISLSKDASKISNSETIYEILKSKKIISKNCDQSPILKALTLANLDRGLSHSTSYSSFVEKRLNEVQMGKWSESLGAQSQGSPASLFWCFNMNEASLQSDSHDRSIVEKGSQPGFGLNQGSRESDVIVQFNPKSDAFQKVAVQGKGEMRGFVCSACGSGIRFETDAQGKNSVVYDDRLLKPIQKSGRYAEEGNELLKQLNAVIASDPFSVAGMSTPRTYIIPNCTACSEKVCDVKKRIQAFHEGTDASIQMLDPLSEGKSIDQSVRLSPEALKTTCIFSMPMIHSCLNSPTGEMKKNIPSKPTQEVTAFDPFSVVAAKGDSLVTLMNQKMVGNPATLLSCQNQSQSTILQSANDLIAKYSCVNSKNPEAKMPTQNEKKDCAEEILRQSTVNSTQ